MGGGPWALQFGGGGRESIVKIVNEWVEYAECRQAMEYLGKKGDVDTVEFEWVACMYLGRKKESFWAGAFGVGPVKFHQYKKRKEKRIVSMFSHLKFPHNLGDFATQLFLKTREIIRSKNLRGEAFLVAVYGIGSKRGLESWVVDVMEMS